MFWKQVKLLWVQLISEILRHLVDLHQFDQQNLQEKKDILSTLLTNFATISLLSFVDGPIIYSDKESECPHVLFLTNYEADADFVMVKILLPKIDVHMLLIM